MEADCCFTGAGSGSGQEEERGGRPASVSSAAPPARDCSAASAGPTAVQPGDNQKLQITQQ